MNKALDYDHGNREYKIKIQASVSTIRFVRFVRSLFFRSRLHLAGREWRSAGQPSSAGRPASRLSSASLSRAARHRFGTATNHARAGAKAAPARSAALWRASNHRRNHLIAESVQPSIHTNASHDFYNSIRRARARSQSRRHRLIIIFIMFIVGGVARITELRRSRRSRR